MLPAIGEATMQHTVRANYDSEMHDSSIITSSLPFSTTVQASQHLKQPESPSPLSASHLPDLYTPSSAQYFEPLSPGCYRDLQASPYHVKH